MAPYIFEKVFLKVEKDAFSNLRFLPGLQSVSSEQMERRTLEMVNAGLQLSFRISRQMTPWLLMLQW